MASLRKDASEPRSRVILAFDLDNMYVACERLRNPALIGKPVGVQQKGLLATASYEARALGVDKLCSLKEAKKRCPSLILVNGEDLTLYRYYSRRVFSLVRSVLGSSPVEKLGMDELFCDVTELLSSHLADREATSPDPRGSWFSLASTDPSAPPDNKGFWYDPPSGCPGYTIPDEASADGAPTTRPSPAIVAASHLSNHIRHLVLTQIGLGSSGGIAHNKTVAKLVGNMHKPHQQTTLIISPDAGDMYTATVRELLDPLDAHKLMGFGWKALRTLREHIAGRSQDQAEEGPAEGQAAEPPLTVGFLRQHFTDPLFRSLLGEQTGRKLWDLLEGKDDEAVKTSPDFPLTISVEDSFTEQRGTLDWQGVLREIEILANSLIRRLEIELVDGGEIDDVKTETSAPGRPRKWQRYPSQIRLTLRSGHSRDVAYNANRESRSAPLPVPVFDLSVPRVERARALVRQPLTGLAKQILDKGTDRTARAGEKFAMSIINIAVTNIQSTTPTKAINAFFTSPPADSPALLEVTNGSISSGAQKRPRDPELDFDMLRELPPDIREEILLEYGLEAGDLDLQPPFKQSRPDHPSPPIRTTMQPGLQERSADGYFDAKEDISTLWASQEDDSDDDREIDMISCSVCGTRVFQWSLEAHTAYHRVS